MLVIAGDRELPRVAVVGSRVRALPRPRFGNIPVHNPRHAAVHAVVTEELEVEPMALSNAVVPQPEWRLSQQNKNQRGMFPNVQAISFASSSRRFAIIHGSLNGP